MATTLTGSVKASVNWDYEKTLTEGNTQNVSGFSYSQVFSASGVAANQVDLMYVTTGTIVASGTLNIDLNATLTDYFGATINMLRVKVLYFNLTTDTLASSILIGNHANALVNWVGAVAHTVRVRNGGLLLSCAPDATAFAITAGTADSLKIVNEDGAVVATYKIAVMGCSA